MKEEELETKFLFRILRLIFYALLLTPLWIWSIFLFPFITTKILYFRLLVELAVIFYVILAIQYPDIRPKWNWLTGSIWIYLGIVFATSLFGFDFSNSFWGTIERGEGIITLLHFAIFFTILPAVFRIKEDWHKYLIFAVGLTGLNALYGMAQFLNLPVVLNTAGERLTGTIGNAAFFAAFMLFGFFLSLYLIFNGQSNKYRIFLWIVLGLDSVALFESQTRGAIIAVAIALFFYFLLNLFKAKKRIIRIVSFVLLMVLIFLPVYVYTNRNTKFVKNIPTLSALANISPSDITTQARLDTWQASFKAWKDRLWTGYGYENYDIAFNKYFPARIFKDQGSQIWFDRAHNIIFDIAVTSGLIGLISYLGIFLAAGIILIKLLRSQSSGVNWQSVIILGLTLAAYFLQNLFVFDTQATYLMFFLLLGHIAFLKNYYLPNNVIKPTTKAGYPPGYLTPIMLTITIFIFAYFINMQPAKANYHAIQGIKLAKLKSYREVKPQFERSLSYGTYMDREIRQKLADYAVEVTRSGQLSREEAGAFYQYVIEELNKNIKESPSDAKNYLYLMNILNQIPGNLGFFDQTVALGEKALRFSPTRPQIYFELGQAYIFQKNFEEGLKQFRKAIELNPVPKESHLNYLLALILAGREELVAQEMKVITKELHYQFVPQDYLSIASAYFRAGNKPKVIEIYQAALLLDPKNPEIHAKLAAAYGEVCDLDQARSHVEETVVLNSSFALEARQFLNKLETKCKK